MCRFGISPYRYATEKCEGIGDVAVEDPDVLAGSNTARHLSFADEPGLEPAKQQPLTR